MLRVGLIGFGRIAQMFHLRSLQSLQGVSLVAVAEADEARRKLVRREAPQVRIFEAYSDLLQCEDIDAVVICLPTAMHSPAAVAAFQAGKHVYLEKPLAIDPAGADAVVEAWRNSGKIGMIGFNFRFHPLYIEARKKLRTGGLGRLGGARSVFTVAARAAPRWKRSRSLGGGVLLDLASHHVDAARFLFEDEIAEVQAQVRSIRYEQDTAVLLMRLRSGLLIDCFFSSSAIDEHRFEVYGTKGKLSFDCVASAPVRIDRPSFPYDRIRRTWDAVAALNPRRLWRGAGRESFQAALGAFADAARAGRPQRPDIEDGYRSLSAVLAAEQSALANAPVLLSESNKRVPA